MLIAQLAPMTHAQADEARHLFILSGQSNMRQPLPDSFRRCVEQVLGKDKVIVVMMGWPSQPIKNWYKEWTPPQGMTDAKPENNGTLYGRLLPAVQKAIKDKPIASVTYVWMQGEADARNGWGRVYEKSFLGVLDQFRQDLKIRDINFVIGRINDFWIDPDQFPDGNLVRSIQQKLGEEHANGDWVDTDDLNRGVNPWGGYSFDDGHFPPAGYRVMGQRFAKKACLLIDPKIELDPAVFEEAFFDTADDVKTHAAIDKPLVSSDAPDTKYNGGKAGVGVLLDGAFAQAGTNKPGWIGFSPREKPIELVIDLGKMTEINSIAINILLDPESSAEFPKKILYSLSDDGKTYRQAGSKHNSISFASQKEWARMVKEGHKSQSALILSDQTKKHATARYMKIQITTGKHSVLIDEVIVNPQ